MFDYERRWQIQNRFEYQPCVIRLCWPENKIRRDFLIKQYVPKNAYFKWLWFQRKMFASSTSLCILFCQFFCFLVDIFRFLPCDKVEQIICTRWKKCKWNFAIFLLYIKLHLYAIPNPGGQAFSLKAFSSFPSILIEKCEHCLELGSNYPTCPVQ